MSRYPDNYNTALFDRAYRAPRDHNPAEVAALADSDKGIAILTLAIAQLQQLGDIDWHHDLHGRDDVIGALELQVEELQRNEARVEEHISKEMEDWP